MKKQFATYEIAIELKKLGFDEPCLGYFNIEYNSFNGEHKGKLILGEKPEYLTCQKKMHYIFGQQICLAPLWQQVEEWFRESHNIHISIMFSSYENKYHIFMGIGEIKSGHAVTEGEPTYEKAREAAIWKAIELLKK